jgi:hypothetical protein
MFFERDMNLVDVGISYLTVLRIITELVGCLID